MRRLLLLALFLSVPASAAETITYAYDARGRLVKVSRSGSTNNGVSACYSYDPADNRSNVTVAMPSASAPSFAINDVSVTEGGSLKFTVTKCGAASTSYSVNFATANGSASSASDYTVNSGTLAFGVSDATKTVTVSTTNDAGVESVETVLVNLSGATGGSTISDAQGVGRIIDND